MNRRNLILAAGPALAALQGARPASALPTLDGRYLFVAVPGVRNYLEYGGAGFLVFDMERNHRWVGRLPGLPLDASGSAENVKGIAGSARTGRIYITTPKRLACFGLPKASFLWQREYPGGCDRMAIAPDGSHLYVPSFEGPHWHVIDARDGDILARLEPNSGAHNTVYDLSGRQAYLAGLKSPYLFLADSRTHSIAGKVGPFDDAIRPFTVDGQGRRCYVNINGLLGFEIGDIRTGLKLARVEIPGYTQGPVKRHGCPSHGIALTPDEREVWLTDGTHSRIHIFDITAERPGLVQSLPLRDQPGWITFSRDGRYCYPSTGEVIEASTRRTVTLLTDELGRAVQSEKMLEIEFRAGKPVAVGDQFGVGRRR